MSIDTIMKIKLELDSDNESKFSPDSDDDSDTCDNAEINRIFRNCHSICERKVAPNNYILQITATADSNPTIALGISDNSCVVYKLSNEQFSQLAFFDEHKAVISELKFCNENSNLLYTGSLDGCVKLWDLRCPQQCSYTFRDSTVKNKKSKQITCFDISPNNRLLSAGTNLFEADAFILFWDIRKHSLLGGYWDSHSDGITQVRFHPDNSNKLISGSVDGLINLYDLSKQSEALALRDSLNTESSVEKLTWIRGDIIGCLTHTADVQFWRVDDAQPYLHLRRGEVAKHLKRKSEEYSYLVDLHDVDGNSLVLGGSNYQDGECLRGFSVIGKSVAPSLGFSKNIQRVRCSWYNANTNLLLTGGEKGILNAWETKCLKFIHTVQ